MLEKIVRALAMTSFASLAMLGTEVPTAAQTTPTTYRVMAPIEQYLMADRSAEISLARTAAPESISRDATVMVLGRHGFETASKGRNGFACLVARSWTSAPDADFWNPKVRVPMCFNAASVRTYLPIYFKKTELALAGMSKTQIKEDTSSAIEKGQLPAIELGAMSYMLSKYGFGGDAAPHWPPHVMFYFPQTEAAAWGANLPGSPVEAYTDPAEHRTEFVVVVQRWSDGTDGEWVKTITRTYDIPKMHDERINAGSPAASPHHMHS